MNFIAYAEPKLSIPYLRQALSVPDTVKAGQALDLHSIIREDSIPKLCKSLVRKSNSGKYYEFAHFTVQEFLEGQMVSTPELEPFRLSKSICNRLLAAQCLNYLQFKDFDHWPTNYALKLDYMKKRNEEHPFYIYAARYWPVYARNEWTDQSLINSATTLFNPVKTGNLVSWALQLMDHYVSPHAIMRLAPQLAHRTFTPLHMAATMSLPVICSALLEDKCSGINQKSGFGTPLQCAVQGLLLVNMNDYVPQWCSDFESYYISTEMPSQEAPKNYMTDTINLLLKAGAEHNIPCSSPFPGLSLIAIALEAATITGNLTATSALLGFGVDPDPEDVGIFDHFCCQIGVEFHGLEYFIRSLGPMTGKSTTHFKLCHAAWLFAIGLGCDFTSDTSIVDTRISLADDALMEALFASIRNEDFERLASVVEDPRVNLTDATNPINGYSPFEEAAKALEYDDCLTVFRKLLDAGCNVSKPGSEGLWPVQMWAKLSRNIGMEKYDSVCEIIREFVRRGTGCTVLTRKGQNVLHLECSAPDITRAFFGAETEENIAVALKTQDVAGYTPISFAVSQGEDEGALLLLQRAGCCLDTLRSPAPILPLCVEMNCQRTFDYLVGANIESQVVGTNGPALLHHITHRFSAGFLDRLISLHPKACTLRVDGTFPLDVYLNSCLCASRPSLNMEVLGVLAKTASRELGAEDKKLVWEKFVSSIRDARGKRVRDWESLDRSQDREKVLDRAASQPNLFSFMQSYEEVQKVSAVPYILEPLGNNLHRLGNLSPISAATMQKILLGTKNDFWEGLRKSAVMVRLLKAAISDQHGELVTLLLAKGVSVHQRTDHLSALELACSTNGSKDAIFTQLLDHANTARLNEINPKHGERKGLIHCLVGRFKERQTRELLKRGADPNLRTMDQYSRPALVYHLQSNSVDTARVLLENGADPNQADACGFNAALSATLRAQTPFLFELMATTVWKIDWQSTGNVSIPIGGKDHVIEMNALHLAAMCDETSCLSFYFDNNLLTDPDAASVELFTPMHVAAMCGRTNSMRFLCDRGANINLKTSNGSLPLHFAVQNAKVEAVEYLASHGSIMATDNFGMSPMAYARQVGNQKIIDYLGNYFTFFTSASQKDTKLVSQAFESALLRADMQTCEELFRQGFCLDRELPGLNGHTPLTWAIEKAEPSTLEWLLARDANAARCVDSGQLYISPLHRMVSRPELNKFLPAMLERYQRDGGSILREIANVACGAVYNNNDTGLRLLFNHIRKYEAPRA